MEQRTFDSVSTGDEMPPMVKHASTTQLFLYSAATHNPHRIHYDREYAAVEGHPDVLVHGPLQGAWLSQFVSDWAGPKGRVLHLSWQNRARAYPNRELTFRGKVTGTGEENGRRVVYLDVWEENDEGQVLMPGKAVVALP